MKADIQRKGISKVLYVDDEEIEHQIMQRLIGEQSSNLQLTCLYDIKSAIDAIDIESFDIILLDNRLFPEADFRESVPKLRKAGFVGPIGIVSSHISDDVIQHFEEYGADFRLGKDEIDAKSIGFILSEYSRSLLPDACREDYVGTTL